MLLLVTVLFLCFLIIALIGIKVYNKLNKAICTCKTDLSGKTILITGGNAGIGFESAKILAKRGARIVMASRNLAKSLKAAQAIIDATGNNNIECKVLDLSKLSSVKQFADDFNKSYDRLDVLINNSGMGEIEQRMTEDRIERTMQINHVGPTYLTMLLLDKLIASKPSRIIFVSSNGHHLHQFDPDDIIGEKPRGCWTRYCNTKLCNVLIAKALSKVLPEGVTANSLSPGFAKTEIFEHGPAYIKVPLYFIIDTFFFTPEQCAQTTVHLACAPSCANVSGEYFDECKIRKPDSIVTDELADRVWKDTNWLIKDRVKNADIYVKKSSVREPKSA